MSGTVVGASEKTGSGNIVLANSPTIVSPTISDVSGLASGTVERDRSAVMPIAPDRDGIAQSQTPGGAGNLTLNGAAISGGVFTTTHAGGWFITFYSAGDDSGRTFTITGTDTSDAPQTENVTGPNNAIVLSTKYFKTVTSVSVDAACAAAIEVGFGCPLIVLTGSERGIVVAMGQDQYSFNQGGAERFAIAIDIPASMLTNGRVFEWFYEALTATNGNNKRIIVNWGSSPLTTPGASTASNKSFIGQGHIIKRGASGSNTQRTFQHLFWTGVTETYAAEDQTQVDNATIRFGVGFTAATADADLDLRQFWFKVDNAP